MMTTKKLGEFMSEKPLRKICGLDISNHSLDELVTKLGIDSFPNDQLLEALIEVMGNINFAFEHDNNFKREQVSLESSPFAYEVYKRFYADRKKPFPPKHPSLKTKHHPSTIQFWSETIAINLLFDAMIADGYYRQNTPPNNGVKWIITESPKTEIIHE